MTIHETIRAPAERLERPSGLLVEELAGRVLADQGAACFDLIDTAFPDYLKADFLAFADEIPKTLQADPYDASGLRRRRYACFAYFPDRALLIPRGRRFDRLGLPKSRYFQPAAYQPEEGNNVRTFDSLTESQLGSSVLSGLVATDFRIACHSGCLPDCPEYWVGIHFICLEPQGRQLAAVSPNSIHRDGELLTFAHLIGKRNVHGGWNAITGMSSVDKHPSELRQEEVLMRFTLEEAGQSYVVDDRQVAHFVEGVGLQNTDEWGHRTVALIDFSPVRRVRSDDLDKMSRGEQLDLGQ
jgi:hypothetical protein